MQIRHVFTSIYNSHAGNSATMAGSKKPLTRSLRWSSNSDVTSQCRILPRGALWCDGHPHETSM